METGAGTSSAGTRRAIATRRSPRLGRLARGAVGDGDEVRRRLDRDREAEALGVARDRGVDADDGARRVEERAAAVAGVDRSVGLEEVVELDRLAGLLVLDRDAPAGRRDDPLRH